MIETLDPNLSLPPQVADSRPVEPIKPDEVSVREQKLEDKNPHEQDQRGRSKKNPKDTVELSEDVKAELDKEDETPVPAESAQSEDDDEEESGIDLLI